MKGCKECPAFSKCAVTEFGYRGSACAALRSTYGVYDDPKIITNADLIRAMSDEELAKWLCEFGTETFAAGVPKYGAPIMNERERLDWLRQPAEEERL